MPQSYDQWVSDNEGPKPGATPTGGLKSQSYDDWISQNEPSSGSAGGSNPLPSREARRWFWQSSRDLPVGDPHSPSEPHKWTWSDQFSHGVAQGYGPELSAFGEALRGTSGINRFAPFGGQTSAGTMGLPEPPSFWDTYHTALDRIKEEKSDYESRHPTVADVLTMAGSTASSLPVNLLTPGLPASLGLAGRMGTAAVRGAETSLMQQHLTGGDVGTNTLTGAGVSALFPVVGSVVSKLAAPYINPEVKQIAIQAGQLGLDLRPGQIGGSSVLKKLDSALASGGNTEQLRDFTKSISHLIGQDTSAITPEIMEQAEQQLGMRMDRLAAGTNVQMGPTLQTRMANAQRLLTKGGANEGAINAVQDVVDDIRGQVRNGTISGQSYQNLTRRGSMLSDLAKHSNSNVREAGGDIAAALFDSLEATNPASATELRQVRDQFRNMYLIEPLVDAKNTSGLIDPSRFATRMRNETGDALALAKAGQFLARPVASGEARAGHGAIPSWAKLLTGAALLEEGTLASVLHDPNTAMAAAGIIGTGYATGKGLGAWLGSRPFRELALGTHIPWRANPLMPIATQLANQVGGAKLPESGANGDSIRP